MMHSRKPAARRRAVGVFVAIALLTTGAAGPLAAQQLRAPRGFSSSVLSGPSRIDDSLRAPMSHAYSLPGLTSSIPAGGLGRSAGLSLYVQRNPLLTNLSRGLGGSPYRAGRSSLPVGRPLAGTTALPTGPSSLAGSPLAAPSRTFGVGSLTSGLSSALPSSAAPMGYPAVPRALQTYSVAGDPAENWGTDVDLQPELPTAAAEAKATAKPAPQSQADRQQIELETKVRGDRNVVLAAKAFAAGDEAGSILRLQIASARHPKSRLVAHMLVRSLVASGSYPQAAYQVQLLLRDGSAVVDVPSLYADAAYGGASRRAEHGRLLAAYAASGRSEETVHLLHAYWLWATGQKQAAGEALDHVKSAPYGGCVRRLRASLR